MHDLPDLVSVVVALANCCKVFTLSLEMVAFLFASSDAFSISLIAARVSSAAAEASSEPLATSCIVFSNSWMAPLASWIDDDTSSVAVESFSATAWERAMVRALAFCSASLRAITRSAERSGASALATPLLRISVLRGEARVLSPSRRVISGSWLVGIIYLDLWGLLQSYR